MSKIFGLDLGTNSIGWAIRNTILTENQIEKFGVITFNKGVGLGKTGEYSYAAERTKKRSVRRLYQAKKYRLWATLEILIREGYCPLTIDDLDKWRKYNKEEALKNNNGGRMYPTWNLHFDAWIKLDFDNDGKPDYLSPYQLRKELAEIKLDFTQEINRHKLGRALYHIAQRRGFKSSRKGADEVKDKDVSDIEVMDLQYSEKKKNKAIIELQEKYPQAKTIGWLFALLENDNTRIRESIAQYAIRENYKDEIKYIFEETQKLGLDSTLYKELVESGKNKNDGKIFYKRPLRSQKGLIGKCTLEPSKYRIPVSHPAFETFRAWSFLNNIKYKENGAWQPLPLQLKKEIYQELFFRKSKPYFPFHEINSFLRKKGKKLELNYKEKTTVSACPVSARLKDIFGENFLNIQIKKEKAPNSEKEHYDIEDIWHVLFHFEDQEYVSEFAEEKLKLDHEKVKQFVAAWNATPVGYGMLSINAINKINIFLQKGLIYTEAVLLAKLPDILGQELWKDNENLILEGISYVIEDNRQQKAIVTTINNLISKHKNLEGIEKFGFKNNDYKLTESDLLDIQKAIDEQFGKSKWDDFSNDEKKVFFDTIKDCFQAYFTKQGIVRDIGNKERFVTIESNEKKYFKTESGYFKVPKLIDTLKEFLLDNFEHLDQAKLSKIYHPSEINIYPPAKEADGLLKLGSPQTGAFKNPMAMRTLHELRKLINFMIVSNQIDSETRVVVEVARDLNDANKRWAIETWQRQREAENIEFAEAILQLLNEEKSINANAESSDDIDKLRLFYEQNTEQTLPPIADIDDEQKGKKKKASEKDEAIRWNGHGKKLIDKYRLWKEQGYQCIYTGKMIRLTDLFKENIIDFEHTVPRSKSFDNSLANLTVCYHDYNRTIKKNQIPTQLANYNEDFNFGGSIGICTAIKPRLKAWEEKIERIKQQIDFWKTKSKKASEKSWKDDAIRQKHLWLMELDYWQNKLNRFTITEITSGFKNSQKVDTQLISKYAFHYLKTYFEKVDVQKGSITAEFRKIYQLQVPDEKKNRNKHSHHAKDAAVLTLIPAAAKRDDILEKYYEAKENKNTFTFPLPFRGFKREFVWAIDDSVLINNITNNQELTPAKRKVRKRGKEVFYIKPDGTKANKWATGDYIRGQLHQDKFYGAIKPAKKLENGELLKDEKGKFIQEENVKYVIRVPFQYKKDANTPGFKDLNEIVDDGIKKQIKSLKGGLKEAFEKGIYLLKKNGQPHGNKIRHIRVWASISEPLAIKKQTYISEKEYKQNYWAANGENLAYGLYENEKKQRGFQLVSLYNVSKLMKVSNSLLEMFEREIETRSPKAQVRLKYVLTTGLKVIFYENDISELYDFINDIKLISNRLYVIDGFEKDGRIRFSHHIDSRSDKDLKELEEVYGKGYWQGYSKVDFRTPAPKLKLSKDSLNMAVENYDFKINMDGHIEFTNNKSLFYA